MILLVAFILTTTTVISSGHDYSINEILIRDLLESYARDTKDEFDQQNEVESEYSRKKDNTVEMKHVNDENHLQKRTIRMPGTKPKKPDTYLCVSIRLPKDNRYIIKYEPNATMETAHHMLLYGCRTPFKKTGYWQCLDMQPVCGSGKQTMVYAWAKNAPSLTMRKDVGFHVGGNSGYHYLVLQVHYLHVAKFRGKDGKKDHSGVTFTLDSQKKRYLAGLYDLPDQESTLIRPHRTKVHINSGCNYTKGPVIYPFRFRTHAHKLATVITGYRVRNGVWKIIGRGDPQKPQMFYEVNNLLDVRPGDQLIGRCTYNSQSRNRDTKIGATHKDEMCNFYIMYYYDSKVFTTNDFTCWTTPNWYSWWKSDVFKHYPKCNDVSLAKMKKGDCTDSSE